MQDDRTLWRDLLARLDRILDAQLARTRARGRTAHADAISGALVVDAEARGLVDELIATHGGAPAGYADSLAALPAGLARAREVYGLESTELDVMVLALAPELDVRYARLFAYLNDHAGHTRPTVGLALELLDGDRLAWSNWFAPESRLTRFGLVDLEGDGPLSTRGIRLAPAFWPRLVRELPAPPAGRALDQLVLDPAVRARGIEIAAAMFVGSCRSVIVRGPEGSGREAIARGLAAAINRPAVLGDVADVRAAVRDARWHHGVLILRGGAVVVDAEPCTIWIGDDADLEDVIEARPDVREIRVDRPGLIAGRQIWESFVPTSRRDDSLDLGEVVARFPLGPRRIEIAAARTLARAERVGTADLLESCRTLPDRRFDGLAERLSGVFKWEDLVVPDDTRRELELVLAWARGGRIALQECGVQVASRSGLACLFHGPPGTGKTMAVQVLASALGLDVMRIDLSRVVNKYIGETEKNLARVFDAAREANVILFFDEADALFGKRTQVKDSHDRYANIETGFLLQRLEGHDGLAILATNLRANLDNAFTRRLHVIAEFPLPEPSDRHRIWQRTLPASALRETDVDLDLLAQRFKLSGGDIRNAVITAALVAAGERRPLGMAHVVRGVWRELRKSGRMVDLDDFGAWRDEALRYVTPRQPS